MRAIHSSMGLRGLGAGQIKYGSVIDTGFGTQVDCSSGFQYSITPSCWPWFGGMSLSAWQAVNQTYMQMTYPNPPAPATPAAPSTQAQMTGAASWTPDQALAAMGANQTQQNQDFFSQVQANVAATQGAAAAGLYDCTKLSQLFTDTNNFWTNCVSGTSWPWIIGGGGALFLLLLLRRR